MSSTKTVLSKISAVILIIFSLLMLVLFGAYVLFPGATVRFVEDMPGWMQGIIDVLNIGDADGAFLTIGSVFEKIGIPSYSFSVADSSAPVIGINLAVIILFVALTIVSYFFPPVSLVTTLGANFVGWIAAIRMIGTFNAEVARGTGTWALASSCFFPMFVLFAVLLFSGCDQWVDVFAGLDERRRVGEYIWYSIAFAVAAVVVAFVLSAISWLIMGIGWAGFVFVAVTLIAVADIILESILLFRTPY